MSRTETAEPQATLRFRIVAWIVITLIRLLRWRVHTVGLEHIPRRGGAVIAWNHHSYVDFLLTAWDIYHELGRPVRFLAKKEVWESPWWGWAPQFAGAIPVDRASVAGRSEAMSAAVQALRDGDLVMVAPEGTISPSFELMSFATGAARMASQAGVPLVPSVSWGTHRALTLGRRPQLSGLLGIPVEVCFGEPLQPQPDDDAREVTEELRATMARMLDGIQRSYPDGTPAGAWWVPHRLGGGAPEPNGALARRARRRASGREQAEATGPADEPPEE